MKKYLRLLISASVLAISANPAHAGGDNDWYQPKQQEETHGGKDKGHKPETKPPVQPTPAPAPQVANGTGVGTGIGTGYGGKGTATAAADAIAGALATNMNETAQSLWNSLTTAQKTEVSNSLSFKLTADQKDQFSGAVNGILKNGDSTSSAAIKDNTLQGGKGGDQQQQQKATANAGAAAGNTTTTTIGGTVYNYEPPIAGAYVQLPPGVVAQGVLVVTTTTCGGDFTVPEIRKIEATTNVAAGFWTSTRENGRVMGVTATATGLKYSPWELVGKDGNMLVEERAVDGFQAVIHSYIVGSSASSGLNLSGKDGAGAVSGAGGIQTYGNEVFKFPCSFKQTRKLQPEPPKTDSGAGARSEAEAELGLARTDVPGPVTTYRLVKRSNMCNGKPIPDGMACVAIRNPVSVLTDANIRLVRAKAEAAAGTKK